MELPRLSHWAQMLMTVAAAESNRLEHGFIGVEHLFLALVHSDRTPLSEALAAHDIDADSFCDKIVGAIPPSEQRPWGSEIISTPRCREVLRLSAGVAAQKGSALVDEAHVLEALLREGNSEPLRRLRAVGVNPAELYEAITPPTETPAAEETPTLDRFGRDLTAQARTGAMTPIVGRDDETALLAQALLRKHKNNPVLVGEAGVGKTAIVEGLAQRIVSKDCPAPLKNARLVELSLASLLAGTKYRGDFEQRLMDVIKEASSVPGLILFLDEIHTVVGAGAAAGEGLDASNIFKPSMARGEIRCIGATTIQEYRRYIEQDAALERRFEKVLVDEPDLPQARLILQAVAAALEDHHAVRIPAPAIEAALEMTVRYVPQRRLPDKAIDALDQSCARVRLNALVAEVGEGDDDVSLSIDAEDVARTVAQWTGIPLERLSGEEAYNLLQMENQLRHRVAGQDHAVSSVARALITARAGLADPNRPSGVFLFLGPTGVGKTELARGMADVMFGDEKRLVRFDMSEFAEPHSLARLIGAPPGYVGYENEGQLIAAVRTQPHSVVLFDEVEKAHSKIFDLFLQIFDEGRLGGAHGEAADFRNTIVILTSNLDLRPPPKEKHVGFVEPEARPPMSIDVRAALSGHFRPELVNRFDEVLLFSRLGPGELQQIARRFVADVVKLAAGKHVRLEVDDDVLRYLIEQSAPERFGARELRRAVDRFLRQPLAQELLRRGESVADIRVSLGKDGPVFL